MREQFVELDFAQYRAQRRLRELRGLVQIILHLDHGLCRIDNAQEDHSVHLQRDVIARDYVLRRNFERFLLERDAHDAIDRSENQDEPRSLGFGKDPTEAEDHATLVLRQDLNGIEDVNDEDGDWNKKYGSHGALASCRSSRDESALFSKSRNNCGDCINIPVSS